MFSQDAEDSIAAFKVYKDPIEEENLAEVLANAKNLCNAAPLTDASNIVKHTRTTTQKGDIVKTIYVTEEKTEIKEDLNLEVTLSPSKSDSDIAKENTISKTVDNDNLVATSSQHSDNIQEHNMSSAEATDKEVDDAPADIIETTSSVSHLNTDNAAELGCTDNATPQHTSIPSVSDSQDFGEDIEFDNETLEKINAIENELQCTPSSKEESVSNTVLSKNCGEAEEDFGPEIDPLVLESMEVKSMRSSERKPTETPSTPVESYEEIKTWLEDFEDAGSMFDVDLDSQLHEEHSAEKKALPSDSVLETLLQASEVDTEKIMKEVNNITTKYGGFTTGSKKPLATSLSTEAVATLFEKKSNKPFVNKTSSIRRSSRPLIPKKRPTFSGFRNARTSSPLHVSEIAKRKAVKAFGEEGALLYQINDKDPIETLPNESTTSDSVKSRRIGADQ